MPGSASGDEGGDILEPPLLGAVRAVKMGPYDIGESTRRNLMAIGRKRLLGALLGLALVFGLMPGMSLTAYADYVKPVPVVSPEGGGNAVVEDATPNWKFTATPSPGYEFVRWSYDDDGSPGQNPNATFTEHKGTVSNWGYITAEFRMIAVESVTLDKKEADLEVDGTVKLTATVLPEGVSDRSVTWSSSDDKVAKVEKDGTVTAVGAGTAKITATSVADDTKSATCAVTVKEKAVPVESVTLDKASADLSVGGTLQLNATALPESATHPDLDWESSDKSVATVNGAGIVTAVADGTAIITVKSTDGTDKSATCKVTVAKEAEKGSYSATAGDGSTWTKGSSDPLTFTFKNSVDDSKTYKAFKGAKVDGADVPETAMATAEGSLVLSLTTTYLETLSVGEHKLTVAFEDGEATATFTVKAAETKAAASSSKSPKTGDGTPVALLASCAALSAVVLLASRTRLRKPGRIGRHAR